MAEWLKAADCKSAHVCVHWFESSPAHQLYNEGVTLIRNSFVVVGSKILTARMLPLKERMPEKNTVASLHQDQRTLAYPTLIVGAASLIWASLKSLRIFLSTWERMRVRSLMSGMR